MEIALAAGLGLVLIAAIAFFIALPRGGQVVGFLRNDHVQSYYVVAVLGFFVIGALSIAAGLTSLDPFGGYK
jgi:hypothetical protein